MTWLEFQVLRPQIVFLMLGVFVVYISLGGPIPRGLREMFDEPDEPDDER